MKWPYINRPTHDDLAEFFATTRMTQSDLPSWTRYLAQNGTGHSWSYELMPEYLPDIWVSPIGRTEFVAYTIPPKNARKTLIRLPDMTSTAPTAVDTKHTQTPDYYQLPD